MHFEKWIYRVIASGVISTIFFVLMKQRMNWRFSNNSYPDVSPPVHRTYWEYKNQNLLSIIQKAYLIIENTQGNQHNCHLIFDELVSLLKPYVMMKYFKGMAHNSNITNLHRNDITEQGSRYNFTLSDVTMLLDYRSFGLNSSLKEASINNLISLYPTLNVLIAISRHKFREVKEIYSNLKSVDIYPQNSTPGSVWNDLLARVTTPVVLVGRNIIYIDKDMELEKALNELNLLGVSAVGGAIRNKNGHWYMGCMQYALRNYSLVYTGGYYHSKHSCVFCKHIDGPFIIDTDTARKVKFDAHLGKQTLYNDFFLRLGLKKLKSAICPYSMFHVSSRTRAQGFKPWVKFALKWSLHSIKFDTHKIEIPCLLQKYQCKGLEKGRALAPCCMKNLAKAINFLFNISESNNIVSAVYAGTLLGALKFNSLVPYDIDSDISFFGHNRTSYVKAKGLMPLFRKHGYKIVDASDVHGKYNVFIIRKNGCIIEWYDGLDYRDVGHEERYKRYKYLGLKPTMVNLDGTWLRTVGNPGLSMWQHYKPEIYKHSQHNRHYGIYFGAPYMPRPWIKCDHPALGGHNCLDQYEIDGNLQFREPYP